MDELDRYKASIESVDTALNRLNQTLASYKLLSASAKSASTPTAKDTPPPPPPSSSPNGKAVHSAPEPARNGNADADVQPDSLAGAPSPSPVPPGKQSPMDRSVCHLRSTRQYPEPKAASYLRLRRIQAAYARLEEDPYCMPLHLVFAIDFLGLGYPDLAAGAAYKALLLSDALDNEAEEYHDEASESLKQVIQKQPLEERIQIIRHAMDLELRNATPSELDPALDVELTLWLKAHYRLIMYRLLTRSLMLCGCLRSALSYMKQAASLYPKDPELIAIRNLIFDAAAGLGISPSEESLRSLSDWPDTGYVRRELYPWNEFEADRLSALDDINLLMREVSTKLEVRTVELPALSGQDGEIVTQLGVFAKDDIAPGEEILSETSLLTANNRLRDALCDACSTDLPDLKSSEGASVISCADCETVFCSEWCYREAMDAYHIALCGKDVDAIAKDVPPAEAADALYSLLLLRVLAMAETQEWHPLELLEVKHIWPDFSPSPDPTKPIYTNLDSADACTVPRTLPFSFEHNIRLPLHMLEKMDIDIFANPQYDVWVFNTLYSKFRGTASARLSKDAKGPEVSAVHPLWCLANHSCDPNVSWEWGGSIKFWARKERMAWTGKGGKKVIKTRAGIKKGQEILNHYCDVNLPVKERREWARGALGGDCQCGRCVFEAKAEEMVVDGEKK